MLRSLSGVAVSGCLSAGTRPHLRAPEHPAPCRDSQRALCQPTGGSTFPRERSSRGGLHWRDHGAGAVGEPIGRRVAEAPPGLRSGALEGGRA